MKDYAKEAQKSLENYSDFLEAHGCSKTENFHCLLAEFNGTPMSGEMKAQKAATVQEQSAQV